MTSEMVERIAVPGLPNRSVGRLLSALAVAVALAGSTALVADAAAPNTKFVSKQYGYSIVLPGTSSLWQSSLAFVTWSTGSPEPGSPAFDFFTNAQTGRYYFVAARRPPTGATLAKWTAFASTPGALGCKAAHSVSSSTLSGAPAHVFTFKCGDGITGMAITALHDNRGYLMLVSSPPGTSSASERSAFDAARATFKFLHS